MNAFRIIVSGRSRKTGEWRHVVVATSETAEPSRIAHHQAERRGALAWPRIVQAEPIASNDSGRGIMLQELEGGPLDGAKVQAVAGLEMVIATDHGLVVYTPAETPASQG